MMQVDDPGLGPAGDRVPVDDDELFAHNIDAEKTREELRIAKTKLGDFLGLIPTGLIIHQMHAIIYANSEAGHLIGIPSNLLIGHHIFDFIDDTDVMMVKERFEQCFDQHVIVRGLEVRLVDIGGHRLVIQLSMSRLSWDGLPVINIVIADISELKQKERELFILSTTDSLTGAYNRRYFMDMANRELQRFRDSLLPLTLMVLDIDHFKRINDTFGHAVGDMAIKAFVAACLDRLRVGDIFGRMGGEEFAILLPHTTLEGALVVGERLRSAVERIVLEVEASKVEGMSAGFTVSIGVSRVLAEDADIEACLLRADRALYEAKASGRNRVVVWT